MPHQFYRTADTANGGRRELAAMKDVQRAGVTVMQVPTPYPEGAVPIHGRSALSRRLATAGRGIALAGVVLPLVLIGILKFTQFEVEALKPLINGTPWLAWLYSVFGYAGTSYLLGIVELITAVLLVASPWSARAGIVGGALGALTFATTISTLLALPIWEASAGGFPFLDPLGSFLIKDVALLGISLVVLGEGLARSGIGTRGHL